MKQSKGKAIITNIITFLILFIILYIAYQFYQTNNFNDFIRSEAKRNTAEFKRDKDIQYNNTKSYTIKSEEYNDAMFTKQIKVNKNTPYKVTCMIKTNQVESKDGIQGVGAQISIADTTEKSNSITGTQDWQKVEFIFNSKNRETIDLGFRLGGATGEAKGKVWFSDFTLEEGINEQQDNHWKFACIIFRNTKVNIHEKPVNIQVQSTEISDIKNTINRFEKSCQELSQGKMKATCDIYEIQTPITRTIL